MSQPTYLATVPVNGIDTELALPLSHEPSQVMDYRDPFLAASGDGSRLVFGYLADASTASNASPLKDQMSGYLYMSNRDLPGHLERFRRALGLDERYQRVSEPDPLVVPLSVSRFGGTVHYAVSMTVLQEIARQDNLWSLPNAERCGAVWVPNKLVRAALLEQARQALPDADPAALQGKMLELAIERARKVAGEYSAWVNGDCFDVVIDVYTLNEGVWVRDAGDSVILPRLYWRDQTHALMQAEAQAVAERLFNKAAVPQNQGY